MSLLPRFIACLAVLAPFAFAAEATSSIIASAGSATLYSGNADVAEFGPCKGDIKMFCKDVGPGEGRLSLCLTRRVRAQKAGNVQGRSITDKCKAEIANFKIDRSDNINKDVTLAKACKDDAARLCKDISDTVVPGKATIQIGAELDEKSLDSLVVPGKATIPIGAELDEKSLDSLVTPGSVLACLRDVKNKLSDPCKEEVFRNQMDAMDDYRTDYKLFLACKGDVKNVCSKIEFDSVGLAPADGVITQDCLVDNLQVVSPECQAQLVRVEKESGDDIHLYVLRNSCKDDLREICPASLKTMDDDPKSALNCLVTNKDKLSEKCKPKVLRMITVRGGIRVSADYGNAKAGKPMKQKAWKQMVTITEVLRDSCEGDLQKTCDTTLKAMDDDPKVMNKALNCLVISADKLSEKCKPRVQNLRMIALDLLVRADGGNDGNAGKPWKQMVTITELLRDSCEGDLQKTCGTTLKAMDNDPKVMNKALNCLVKNKDKLSEKCQDPVFIYELQNDFDLELNKILQDSCENDLQKTCNATLKAMDDDPKVMNNALNCLVIKTDKLSDKCKPRVQTLRMIALDLLIRADGGNDGNARFMLQVNATYYITSVDSLSGQQVLTYDQTIKTLCPAMLNGPIIKTLGAMGLDSKVVLSSPAFNGCSSVTSAPEAKPPSFAYQFIFSLNPAQWEIFYKAMINVDTIKSGKVMCQSVLLFETIKGVSPTPGPISFTNYCIKTKKDETTVPLDTILATVDENVITHDSRKDETAVKRSGKPWKQFIVITEDKGKDETAVPDVTILENPDENVINHD